jgi:hypothetical protein
MTDIPIIFSGPMVRAVLNGRKTMTRRILKPQPERFSIDDQGTLCDIGIEHIEGDRRPRIRLGRVITLQEVRWAVGDRLWVRENLSLGATSQAWKYSADDKLISMEWPDHRVAQMVGWAHHQERDYCPSIHMPRWASRLTLVVTALKIEPVQDISDDDVLAEGGELQDDENYYRCWRRIWVSVNGRESWDANPIVVAITFTVHKQNIDQISAKAA